MHSVLRAARTGPSGPAAFQANRKAATVELAGWRRRPSGHLHATLRVRYLL